MRRLAVLLSLLVLGPCSAASQVSVRTAPALQVTAKQVATTPSWQRLSLFKTRANLRVLEQATHETYEVYFHVPIATERQVPVMIDVACPYLIDYRFVQRQGPNLLVAANLAQAPAGVETVISWESWVLTTDDNGWDLPTDVPLPDLEQIPEEARAWLQATDCVQSSDPYIQAIADDLRAEATTVQDLLDLISEVIKSFPSPVLHDPYSCDAFYALMSWGATCTGNAHAFAALLRANGIPARSLHVMPKWTQASYDMHWIIEYWLPDRGWARYESSLGRPSAPDKEVVTMRCYPEDERPLFYPGGLSGYWHSSDPALGMESPMWGEAHYSTSKGYFSGDASLLQHAFTMATQVFSFHTRYQGIGLHPAMEVHRQEALAAHAEAAALIKIKDLDGYLEAIGRALDSYERIRVYPLITVFADDFETAESGWLHGGDNDEWELGSPSYGPSRAHSGASCWGTDLDDTYESNSDSWLLSPPINLEGFACASLSFWVENRVQDRNQAYVYDPLWLDITTDGERFIPLCSHMGGGNDDPAVPVIGGWVQMHLDLSKYVGHDAVQIRFRFQSDATEVQAGSYIDDVRISGRPAGFQPAVRRPGGRRSPW